MDKRRAIQIMTRAAALYHADLEDQKVIFLYGVPAEVRKQLQEGSGMLLSIKSYEVAFHRYNFLHLTGVKVDRSGVVSAIHFYEKCLDNRLKLEDFSFAKDGSTAQKLDILENMMGIKRNVPNTLLKKDIRDVTVSPAQKIYAVLSRNYTEGKYSVLEKVDKGMDIKKCFFAEGIEQVLDRGAL